jgi:RNA polymerase sigma factor (sigma-70 family)
LQDAIVDQYERSRRQLRAVAARYVGDEAEDVVQDAFLNALRSGHGFRGEATPLTWLHRIVVNVSINHCRRRRRWEFAHLRDAHHRTSANAAFEETLAIRAALRQLTSVQSRVFVMYDMLGHTHKEIARRLAIPSGTSKSRLSDARRRLREALGDGRRAVRSTTRNPAESLEVE